MIILEGIGVLSNLGTRRDGKASNGIDASRFAWRNEVGQRVVRLAGRLLILLAKHMKFPDHGGALRVSVELDIISYSVCGPQGADSSDAEPFLFHDRLENLEGILMELRCLSTDLRIREKAGITAPHFPCRKEGRPVEVLHQLGQRYLIKGQHTRLFRHGKICLSPVDRSDILPSDVEGQKLSLGPFASMLLAESLVIRFNLEVISILPIL